MMTSYPSQQKKAQGFTLVELLTVVTIIVILAGIVMGAVSSVKKVQAKKETKVRLATLHNKLEDYTSDNGGIYPVGDNVLSKPLYNALSGDFTGTGEEPTGEVYWPELLNKKASLIKREGGEVVIIDAYLNSFRYRAELDINGEEVSEAKNQGYDLWSLGPDGEPSDLNIDSKAQSDKTEDDIWK